MEPALRRCWRWRLRNGLSGSGLAVLLLLAGCSELPGAYEARLADYLRGTGATLYGAYWCPHSAVQKDYFGGSADRLPYVECDAQGLDAQPALCAEMGIDQYPTWIIDGEYYFGTQRPAKLAVLSGFEAPADERFLEDSSNDSSEKFSEESSTEYQSAALSLQKRDYQESR